jgi:HPt (histidine-containing phosphotransfer) domain-containing protein
MEEKDISFAHIEQIANGKTAFIKSVLAVIQKNLAEYPMFLFSDFTIKDYDKLKQTAHKFKSSTAYLGYKPLDTALNELENYKELSLTDADIQLRIDDVQKYSLLLNQAINKKLSDL